MPSLTVLMIIFVVYWLIILRLATSDQEPKYKNEYEDGGYGQLTLTGKRLVIPGKFFSRKEKGYITGVWATITPVSILFWYLFSEKMIGVSIGMFKFLDSHFGCCGIFIAILLLSCVLLVLFLSLPIWFIQKIGLSFSGRSQ